MRNVRSVGLLVVFSRQTSPSWIVKLAGKVPAFRLLALCFSRSCF